MDSSGIPLFKGPHEICVLSLDLFLLPRPLSFSMASSSNALPDPFGLRSKFFDVGLSVVDNALETTAILAEKVHHAHSEVSEKTELEGGDGPGQFHSPAAKATQRVRTQIKAGAPVSVDPTSAAALGDALTSNADLSGLNDRLYLLEDVLVLLSRLPRGAPLGQHLNNKVIDLLYEDLAHPPSTLIGKKYRYRSADGSGTSIWNHEMGKAGTSYARSVQGIHPLPANELPAPELLFDTLLKRDGTRKHPGGLSSHFFAFANLVIHSLFHTDHRNEGINKTSSYLDLSPIYGNDKAEQDSVRIIDGYGRLRPDTFADKRLLQMPPSTPALLILFCRNHNYIAQKLLEINERGEWTDPPPSDKTKRDQQDEDIFQTARLINCGYFMNTILSDYLSAILGLIREGNSWSLNPLEFFRNKEHDITPRGEGNQVSIEFTALYHFHASISANEEKWTEDKFRSLFGEKTWDEITIEEFRRVAGASAPKGPPETWVFHPDVKRDPVTNQFSDADLARILQDATSNPACAFGARGTPHVMRVIEIMGIIQNRVWGSPSLNEFRKFLGLTPFSTFEEWNPNKAVADAARRLYHHPDNIELYVGLQAEDTKIARDGAGLCPGFTVSRAILADAVALVRGDRFLTTDYTAHNLTSWGMNYAARNPDNSAFGGMIPKLLMTHLPDYYPANSAYTNFPFMAPESMEGYMRIKGVAHKYQWSRPTPRPPIRLVDIFEDAKTLLKNPNLHSDSVANVKQVLPGNSYLGSYNDREKNQADKEIIAKAFYPDSATKRHHADVISKITQELIRDKSFTLSGSKKLCVNVVKDVLNLIPVHFIAFHILGLPLKTERKPQGTLHEAELLQNFREIFDYIFTESNLDSKVAREESVKDHIEELQRIVKNHLSVLDGNPIAFALDIAGRVLSQSPPPEYSSWLKRLHSQNESKLGHDEMANHAISLAIVTSVQLSQALVHVVDAFLDDDKKPQIVALARSSDSNDAKQLLNLITEALRLNPITGGTYRDSKADVSVQGGSTFKKSERIYISYVKSNQDPKKFGDGAKSFQAQPTVTEALEGDGIYRLHGQEYVVSLIYPVIKYLFGTLKNIHRAPGNSGKLASFTDTVHGTEVRTYFDQKKSPTPWSSNLTVSYDN